MDSLMPHIITNFFPDMNIEGFCLPVNGKAIFLIRVADEISMFIDRRLSAINRNGAAAADVGKD